MSPPSRIEISVIIPSFGRSRALTRTLDDLARQSFENWECLVVAQDDQADAAATLHPLMAQGRMRVLRTKQQNASLARNVGLTEAHGAVVLFIDDDVRIEDTRFLETHVKNYRDPAIPGVAGQILSESRQRRTSRRWRAAHERVGWLYHPYEYAGRCRLRAGRSCNLSVRRELALRIGGMDAQFERGAHREEADFCLRLTDASGPLVFDPHASLVHLRVDAGGNRSWGMNRGLHPVHHVTGEWYFILKNLFQGRIWLRDLPDHLYLLVRRQIFNGMNLRAPWNVMRATLRSGRGLFRACRKLAEGPRYLRSPQNVAEGSG